MTFVIFHDLGVFQYSHMQFEALRGNDSAGEPSIAEMTDKAIRILSKNPNGFFLFVEGKSDASMGSDICVKHDNRNKHVINIDPSTHITSFKDIV